MSSFLKNRKLHLILRILFALIFITASVSKISDPISFATNVQNFNVLPDSFVNLFAVIIPWIEFTSGLLLLFNFYVRENIFILSGLLVIFTLVMIFVLINKIDVSCGCYGDYFIQKVNSFKVIENIILIILGSFLYKYAPTKSQPSE